MADLRSVFGIAPDVEKEQALRELFPTTSGAPTTNEVVDRATPGEFNRGLRSGYYGAVQAAPRALIGAAQDAFGFKDAAQQSYDNVNAILRRAADSAPTTKWADVNDPRSLGLYAAGAVGNALATTLPGVAVGLATRSPTRGLMTMFPMEAGETAAEVAQMPANQRPDPRATLRASLAKGAVNTAIEAAPFAHLFGKGPLRSLTRDVTNPVARFAGRAGVQMGAEGGTEYLQEATGQEAQSYLQPGRDKSGDPEARAESFRQGFFGAAPFGGMAGISGTVQDAHELGKSGLSAVTDFMKRSKGKPAEEILKDIQGQDREKRYSMFINGNPTAEEDVVKHGENSLLSKAIGQKNIKRFGVDLRELGAGLDAYLRNEVGRSSKEAVLIEQQLENLMGSRDAVDKVFEYYSKGINDTNTLVRNRDEVKAEMDRPPAWLDSDGVTSFSEADLGLNDEERKSYVAEEHGLQNLTDTNTGYIYDGTLSSKRPFANKNAGRAGVERALRMNPHIRNADRISVLQQAYETGGDPEEIRRELYKEMTKALQEDVNEGNKAEAKGDKASVERAKAKIRDGNDILRKLGKEIVDPESGEVKFDKSAIEALDDIYVVRTDASADDQRFSPRELAQFKPTNDKRSVMTFVTETGKEVNLDVRAMMKAHMKRANSRDDQGAIIPPRAWMYRAFMSGMGGLLNPERGNLTLKTPLTDDLVVWESRDGKKRVTLGELKAAEAQVGQRTMREGENAADMAEREKRSDASAYYRDANREGPEGTAGEGFDPNSNTLRDQQPGGPPIYNDAGEEIRTPEHEASVRKFNENIVGESDVARVGEAWPTGEPAPQFEGTFKQPDEKLGSLLNDDVGKPTWKKTAESEAREAIRGKLPPNDNPYGRHKPADWPADRVWPDDAYQTNLPYPPEDLPQAPQTAPHVEPIKEYDLTETEPTPTSDELKLLRAAEVQAKSSVPGTQEEAAAVGEARRASGKTDYRGKPRGEVSKLGPSETTKLDPEVVRDLFDRLNAAKEHLTKLPKDQRNTPNLRKALKELRRTHANVMDKADQLSDKQAEALTWAMRSVNKLAPENAPESKPVKQEKRPEERLAERGKKAMHHEMPMRFKDGIVWGGVKHTMRPEFSGKSTMDLIESGDRTATTRRSPPLVAVGDTVTFTDGSRKVDVRVTKAPYLVSTITPEQWSKLEGWSPEVYQSYKDAWQFQYELMSPKAAATKEERINVYSKSDSALGRMLSNFANTPFEIDGRKFQSVEGWWYFQSLARKGFAKQAEPLQRLYGYDAKQAGKAIHDAVGMTRTRPPEKEDLKRVYMAKLEANPKVKEALLASGDAKFDHYYVYGGKRVDATQWAWTAELWAEVRDELRAPKTGASPTETGASPTEAAQGDLFGEAPKAEPKATKKRKKLSEAVGEIRRRELLQALKVAGGVKLSIASDITGDKGRNATRSMPGLFRTGGMNADMLVEFLQERGYLPRGENELDLQEQAFDFVRKIVNKERLYQLEDEGRYQDSMRDRDGWIGSAHRYAHGDAEGRGKLMDKLRNRLYEIGPDRTPAEMLNNIKTAARLLATKFEIAPFQRAAYISALDLMSSFASMAKNPKAEKWLRANIKKYSSLHDFLVALTPHLEDKKDIVLAKAVAKALANASTSLEIGTKELMENLAGGYIPAENRVLLRDMDGTNVQTLLHESVHAATVHALANNQEVFDALTSLLEHTRANNKSFARMYGETNTLEFLSEGLTNPFLRGMLRRTKASDEVRSLLGNVKDMWHAFVRTIRMAIGMPESEENALSQFLDLAGTLLRDAGTGKVEKFADETSIDTLLHKSSPSIRRRGVQLFRILSETAPRVAQTLLDTANKDAGLDRIVTEMPFTMGDIRLFEMLLDQVDPAYMKEMNDFAEEDIVDNVKEMASVLLNELPTLLPQPTGKNDVSDIGEPDPLRDRKYTHFDDAVTDNALTKAGMDKIRELIVKMRGAQVNVMFKTALEIGPADIDEHGHEVRNTRAAGRYTKDSDDMEAKEHGRRLIELAFDVSFRTAESAAYHEAMHDFLATMRGLGSTPEMRAAAATLEGLHKNVEVMMQLKELLKDHPEAWKSAQDDANEAAAYVFQFWMNGKISVAPAPRNLFEKLAKFFRDVLGLVSSDDKARILMSALAKGDFSKPSVASTVLNRMKAETFNDKAKRIAGPLMNVTSVLVTSSTDRLREMNIPAFTEIADLFHKEADQERGRVGFLQKVAQTKAQWRARLNTVLSGHTDAELKEALDIMQARKDSDMPLVKGLRELLDDIYQYMSFAGVKEAERKQVEVWDPELKQMVKKTTTEWVDIKKVGYNYFPRFWDPEAILRDTEKFIGLLTKYGELSEVEAREVVGSITSAPQDEIANETAYTPFLMSANNRRLHFINKANAAEFAEFQKQDLVEIMTNYVDHATRRAESTRSFGHAYGRVYALIDKGKREGATQEDVEVVEKAVAGMTGALRHDMDRNWRQFMTNMIAYENVVLLPFALLNNLTDVVHIALRSGDLNEGWRAFGTGIAEIKRAIFREPPSEQKKFAEMLGTIDETVALGAYGEAYEGMYMTGFARKLNDAFFKYNGMQTWNHAMRTAATQAAMRFIMRHATGEKTEHSDRFLYELGLEREQVQKLIKDGMLAVTRDEIATVLGIDPKSAEAAVQETKIQEALYRFVDDAALRPNAAHRPIWGSDPYFMLIWHLKQFTFTFQAVTAKFMNKELAYGNAMPIFTLMVYAPFALAIQTVRSLMLGKPIDSSLSGILMSLAKSGTMLGTGTFGLDALKDTAMSRVPGISLIGPAPAHGLQALQTLLGADGTSLAKLAERSAPLSPLVKAALE